MADNKPPSEPLPPPSEAAEVAKIIVDGAIQKASDNAGREIENQKKILKAADVWPEQK